jgi:integrase
VCLERRHLSKLRSGAEVGRILDREILAAWGARLVTDIRRVDLVALLDRVEDRGTIYARNRLAAHTRKFFNWLIGRGLEIPNPASRVVMIEESARERVLSADELRWFWKASGQLGYPFGPLFRLLALTGQRREEVGTMPSSITGETEIWEIPGSKTKNGKPHLVALCAEARAIIAEVRKEMPPKSAFLFSTTGKTPVSGYSKAKRRLERMMQKVRDDELARAGTPIPEEGIPEFTLHDLRRTFTTGLAELKVPPHVIEKALNHLTGVLSGVAGVYNRFEYLEERVAAMKLWSVRLLSIVEERPMPSNVVSLPAVAAA